MVPRHGSKVQPPTPTRIVPMSLPIILLPSFLSICNQSTQGVQHLQILPVPCPTACEKAGVVHVATYDVCNAVSGSIYRPRPRRAEIFGFTFDSKVINPLCLEHFVMVWRQGDHHPIADSRQLSRQQLGC